MAFGSRIRPFIVLTCLLSLTTIVNAGHDVSAPPVHAVPTITSINPTSGPEAGGTSVVITGTGFHQGGDAVLSVNFVMTTPPFTSTGASFTVDPVLDQITVTSPGVGPGTGVVDLIVGLQLGEQSATSAADQFTYTSGGGGGGGPLPPHVDSINPGSGPAAGGTPVTITGSDFTGATEVRFGSIILTTGFAIVDSSHITTTTPAGTAGAGVQVKVTTPVGTSSDLVPFVYVAAPTVTAVSPTRGSAAGVAGIVITGTDLTGATAVKFGATPATTFNVDSATQVTATAPAGTAGNTVDVTVTTAGGTSATGAADKFTYDPAPTVTSVFPTGGAGGVSQPVTLTGANFGSSGAAVTSVTYGPTTGTEFTASSFTWQSSASLVATIGSQVTAGTAVKFIVTINNVASALSSATYTGLFAPSLNTVTASPGTAGQTNTITLTGTNFGTDASQLTSVQIGTNAVSSKTWLSATQVLATADSTLSAGTYDVTITTLGGTSTKAGAFTLTAPIPAPSLNTVTPSSATAGQTNTITLIGTNFGTDASQLTSVKIGTNVVSSTTWRSTTQVLATADSTLSAGTYDVTITTTGGTSTKTGAFTLTAPVSLVPTVASINPTTGPASGGTPVVITGTNFTGVTAVKFGGVNAKSFVPSNSTTSITATTPAGLGGTANVEVTASGGTSSPNTLFTFVPEISGVAMPTGIVANAVPANTAFTVTIAGAGFANGATVTYGPGGTGSTVSATVVDSSTLTATLGTNINVGDSVQLIVISGGQASAVSTTTLTAVPSITNVFTNVGNGSSVTAGVPTSITIAGTGFASGSTVTYGTDGTGSNATVDSVNSAGTQITATVTLSDGSVAKFKVTTSGKTSSASSQTLTGVAPPAPPGTGPTILSISPKAGTTSGGTPVVIAGTNFTGVTAVSFGNTPATSFTTFSETPTLLTAVSPAGSANAQGAITVTAGGQSATSSQLFTWCGTPSVTSVTPSVVSAGTGVTVSGTNFCPSESVVQLKVQTSLGSHTLINQTSTFLSQFQMSFIANVNSAVSTLGSPRTRGARTLAAVTGIEVIVTGPGGTSPSNPAAVISIIPAPVVSAVTPASGPLTGGTSVTITGSNFAGASAVRFGSVAASTFSVLSDSSIVATSPANSAGAVDVVVVTASGSSVTSVADLFTYSTSVPTMGEWFMWSLALLLASAGYLNLRRRQQTGRA